MHALSIILVVCAVNTLDESHWCIDHIVVLAYAILVVSNADMKTLGTTVYKP